VLEKGLTPVLGLLYAPLCPTCDILKCQTMPSTSKSAGALFIPLQGADDDQV